MSSKYKFDEREERLSIAVTFHVWYSKSNDSRDL